MHDQEHHGFTVEQEQPDNRSLAVYGVAIIFVFFGSGIALTSLFYRANDMVLQRRGAGPALELRELRTREDERLNSYGWVDKEKQIAHIPIDQAMKLLVEGDKR